MPKGYLKVRKCQKCQSIAPLACIGRLLQDLKGEEKCCFLNSPSLSVQKRAKGLLSSLRLMSSDWLMGAGPWVIVSC